MRSIAGLVITNKIIGVLRADTLGVEQCTFSRDCSRGALDTIRVCLGLVRSTSLERGQHEAFELANTTTIAPPHLKPAKVKTSNDVFNEDPRVEYIHRTVRFIRLRGRRLHYSEDQTKPNIITYYVHHLVQDNGSLIGRCPRIFCVSRETESTDTVRHFVGPYALKLYYADHASDCYRDDLISAARNGQVKNVLLPTWEWHYGDALSLRGLPPDVVHHYSLTHEHALHNREEIFAQSDLKRLLVQCSSYDEFAQAFINFAEAIASLAERNFAHRDLSIGNVLLSHDTPCPSTFFSEATASAAALLKARVTFTQRALEQRVGGLIHDMDMAGRLHRLPDKVTTKGRKSKLAILKAPSKPQPPLNSVVIEKGFRTGTPPFMAIGLLVDGPPHFVAYDLHSLLFVMVLFFWSYPRFKADVPFPCPVPTRTRTWPSEVLRWANRPVGFSLAELGGLKRIFFSKHEVLRQTLNRTLEGDLWTEDSAYLDLFWALYATLWSPSDETAGWTDLKDVIPEEVIEALKEAFHDDGSL